MATTTNYTALYTGQTGIDLTHSSRSNQPRLPAPVSKKLEFMRIPYTLLGTEDDDDPTSYIYLCELPPGSIPRPEYSNVVCSADPGTALTIDIGTAADPDGWADGMVLDAGSVVQCLAPAIPAYMVKTELAADTGQKNVAVYATLQTATTLTAAVILYFCLAYELPG